jgi:hypothetical protein
MRRHPLSTSVLSVAVSLLTVIRIKSKSELFSVALLPIPLSHTRRNHLVSGILGYPYCSSHLDGSVKLDDSHRVDRFKTGSVASRITKVANDDFLDVASSVFDNCWNATSWSVNPSDLDRINHVLECFNSPAPQVYFAFTRALTISNDTKNVLQTFSYMLKKGYQFQLRCSIDDQASVTEEGLPPENGFSHISADGLTEWRVVPSSDKKRYDLNNWETIRMHSDFPSTLSIAHFLLERSHDHSMTSSDVGRKVISERLAHDSTLVRKALSRLNLTLGVDIRGRSAADAAFAFAMAGVDHPKLYHILTRISFHELKRIGRRPSFPSKSVLRIVEKLAAAGVQTRNTCDFADDEDSDVDSRRLFLLAANLLDEKPDSALHEQVIRSLRATMDDLNFSVDCKSMTNSKQKGTTNQTLHLQKFGLHSTRSLVWLWRFAARQTKVGVLLDAGQPPTGGGGREDTSMASLTAPTYQPDFWLGNYGNSSLPLIVDLGCGMGVSLLGLSTMTSDDYTNLTPVQRALQNITWLGQHCNYVGGDLDRLSINYARGIARRWGIDDRLQFVWKPALELLQDVNSSYPSDRGGKVAMIMIQFPTPYRFVKNGKAGLGGGDEEGTIKIRSERPSTGGGNKQLPFDSTTGFMANLGLFQVAATILRESDGYLLLQSNCEDVAVTMRRMAVHDVGFECVDVSELDTTDYLSRDGNSYSDCSPVESLPLRTREWISMGGERAVGPGWFTEPILPRNGRTETEVNCNLHGIPVHRCLLKISALKVDG